MNINIERFKETFDALSEFGKTEKNGLNRPALSDTDKKARDTFCQWMRDAGMEVRIDDAGNYYGHRKGLDDTLPPVVMGSHLDSVYYGGRFDGITGVQAALEVVRTLNDNHIITKRPIEAAVFTNEEGTRFEPSMLGSGVLAGVFDIADVYQIKDMDGISYEDELTRIGYKGRKENRLKNADTYLELHVEQGPVLEREKYEVGVLSGIRGMVHLECVVKGVKDHAGPSPMEYRKDAMLGTAMMITRIHDIAYEVGKGTTTTVGKVNPVPCSSNVIPGEVHFSVDIRNEEDEYMNRAVNLVEDCIRTISRQQELSCEINEFWRVDAIHFPKEVVDVVEKAAVDRGYRYKMMVSGAGHDASYLSGFVPTAMIFVPSVAGLSHCEEEYSRFEDIEKGVNMLLDAAVERADR